MTELRPAPKPPVRNLGQARHAAAAGVVIPLATAVLFAGATYVLGVLTTPPDNLGPYHGDVELYRTYAQRVADGLDPYRHFPVEYPPLSFLAFLLPWMIAGDAGLERVTYARLLLAQNAALVGMSAMMLPLAQPHLRLDRRLLGALGVLGLLTAAMIPLLPYRFDMLPATFAMIGVVAATFGSPMIAGLFVGMGMAAKLYPAILVPLLVAFYLAANRRKDLARFLVVAGIVSVLALLPSVAQFGLLEVASYHTERGLQLESLYSGLLAAAAVVTGDEVSQTAAFGSSQIQAPGAEMLSTLALPLLIAALGTIVVSAFLRFRADALTRPAGAQPELPSSESLIAYAVAMLVAFMGFNKVLSPQYLIWILPLVPFLPLRFGVAAVALCMLTVINYPLVYADRLRVFDPEAVAVLNLRNIGLVAFAAWLLAAYRPQQRGVTTGRVGLPPVQ